MGYAGNITGTVSSTAPREDLTAKMDNVGERVSVCIGLAKNIQDRLFGEEAAGEPPQCYPTCIEGNVESIRDRLNQLENMLTRINDRL